MTKHRALRLASFILGASFFMWGLFVWYKNEPAIAHNTPLPLPLMKADSFIEALEMEAFTASGQLSWKMNATDSLHTNRNFSTAIRNPHFVMYETDGKTIRWQVKSKDALAFHQKKMRSIHHLDLITGVELMLHPNTAEAVTLHTNKATFTPQSSILTTDEPVSIESAAGSVEGIGLSANLKSNQMRILKGVKGSYGASN